MSVPMPSGRPAIVLRTSGGSASGGTVLPRGALTVERAQSAATEKPTPALRTASCTLIFVSAPWWGVARGLMHETPLPWFERVWGPPFAVVLSVIVAPLARAYRNV